MKVLAYGSCSSEAGDAVGEGAALKERAYDTETRFELTTLVDARTTAGASGRSEKAKVCCFQTGPVPLPHSMAATRSKGAKVLYFSGGFSISVSGPEAC